ncbi:MAG: VCBS repeat-containing protein, partial [Gemmatimonadota bacterium]
MAISRRTVASVATLAFILVGIPLLVVLYEARRSGRSVRDYLAGLIGPWEGTLTPAAARGPTIQFLEPRTIGYPIGLTNPWISHLTIADLDRDGLMDVVVCDIRLSQITWIRQEPAGTYTERPIGSRVSAPGHVTPSDIDLDGDLDLLVADMGMILPNNDKIGSVIVLENTGDEQFSNRVLIERIARVTDVQPGDFDGDGDVDL